MVGRRTRPLTIDVSLEYFSGMSLALINACVFIRTVEEEKQSGDHTHRLDEEPADVMGNEDNGCRFLLALIVSQSWKLLAL